MPEDNVVRIKTELYQQAKDLAQAEGISLADAVSKLVETGGSQPSSCELSQFRRVLEARGLTAPKHPDWVWGVTDVLPADMLAGTKMEPYAEARREAELRCTLGNELYDKLIGELGSVEAVEKAVTEPVSQTEAEIAQPEAEASTPTEVTASEAEVSQPEPEATKAE